MVHYMLRCDVDICETISDHMNPLDNYIIEDIIVLNVF